jgi:hypothetical protein
MTSGKDDFNLISFKEGYLQLAIGIPGPKRGLYGNNGRAHVTFDELEKFMSDDSAPLDAWWKVRDWDGLVETYVRKTSSDGLEIKKKEYKVNWDGKKPAMSREYDEYIAGFSKKEYEVIKDYVRERKLREKYGIVLDID